MQAAHGPLPFLEAGPRPVDADESGVGNCTQLGILDGWSGGVNVRWHLPADRPPPNRDILNADSRDILNADSRDIFGAY